MSNDNDQLIKNTTLKASPFSVANCKRIQNEQAVKLLKHFTKGTQSYCMFRDHNALWGYTRQKFTERATLLCKSLHKLHPDTSILHENERQKQLVIEKNPMPDHKLKLKTKAWEKLKDIRFACSIGCGPGNDAVGLLAFLRHYVHAVDIPPTHFLLLDWAISDWETTLCPLHSVLENRSWISNNGSHSKSSMNFAFCDVTKSLDSDENAKAFPNLHDSDWNHMSDNQSYNSSNEVPAAKSQLHFDIYLTSYLVSETRGKWELFYKQLIHAAKPGALFYFAEPTPWQLHKLCELCDSDLDFLWIDSSMHHPKLQILDRRVGPAVLLGIRKDY